MAVTNFSPLLGLALPTTGDLSGTWGNTVNVSITALLDSAVAGTTTLSADSDVTLTTTNGAANQARNAILLCTGARSSLKTITAPAQSKAYIVINSTTGGYAVKVVGSGPTTGITVSNGEKALIAWNGSDYVIVSRSLINLSTDAQGVLPIANGGTGTATPNLTAGSGVTISGTWPNQTISNASPGIGSVTSVTGTGTANGLTLSGTVTSSGNITLSGSVISLTSANFSISEIGGVLVFKYGATTIATLSSTGVLTTLSDITGNGTP